ncbi:MAG: hypothetical protein ABWY58_09515 [Aeromicrobium sp.]
MILQIEIATVRLDELDDLDRLSARVARRAELPAWAEVVGDGHLAVDPAVLAGLAGARGSEPAWRARFDAMLDRARSHGWTTDAGRVRLHVDDSQGSRPGAAT